MTERCKTDEEFAEKLAEILTEWSGSWRNQISPWVLASYPKSESTWEKILEQYEALCLVTNSTNYRIMTAGEGFHSLWLLLLDDTWAHPINYTPEDEFLKRLTAMVDERRPVTAEEAWAAWLTLNVKPSDVQGTLHAYLKQQRTGGDA